MSRAFLLCLFALASAPRADDFKPPGDSVLLDIPDRPWVEGAPSEGWCGEASIQMVALHCGAWLPQSLINAAGKSTHVDLWEEDVPVALDKLGFSFERAKSRSRAEFLTWIIDHVRLGHPVVVGAKVFPSEHPAWDVDHLMPVVGFSRTGLVFNTNMEWGQKEIPYAALGGTEGISFKSPAARFYGFAVLGFRPSQSGLPVNLSVRAESKESVRLAVKVKAGAWLLRRDHLDGGVSTGPLTDELQVAPGEASRFEVIPAAR